MKYCENCIHYFYKNNTHLCKAFAFTYNYKLNYIPVDYARIKNFLCSMEANSFIDKKDILYNNNFNKAMKKLK